MGAGWPRALMGEIAPLVRRPIEPDAATTYREIGIRSFGKGVFHKPPTTGLEIGSKRVFAIEPGDLLFNIVFAWEGAVAVASDGERGMIGSHRFLTCVVDPRMADARFLNYWFSRGEGRDRLLWASPGGAGRNRTLGIEKLAAIEVPLPPIDEQRRIVARIDALAAKIAEAKGLREAAVAETGACVPSARQRIYLKFSPSEVVRLGDVCRKITDGPHVSPRYVETGVPFISARNIRETGIDFSTAKYVSTADHADFSRKAPVEPGDVLYTKGGTTGVARRVDTNRQFSIWVHVALLKLNSSRTAPGYIEHMLNSPACKEQAEGFTRGSTNRDLGLTRMSEILFPLPSLDEQRRIVAELDALQAKVDAVKRLQAETAAELGALLPALLDRAFKGDL